MMLESEILSIKKFYRRAKTDRLFLRDGINSVN